MAKDAIRGFQPSSFLQSPAEDGKGCHKSIPVAAEWQRRR
jgi:hypothetical protein